MRTFGVEEELLLVDPATGLSVPRAAAVMGRYRLAAAEVQQPVQKGSAAASASTAPTLATELQQEQIEVIAPPRSALSDLEAEILAGRALADACARASGARAVALATSPSPAAPHPAPDTRVQALRAQFGLTAEESLTSSCHVHVSVDSEEEGVAVLDRIRIWLPVLAALSSNSPFWQGRDTGYAGYRTQAWLRWPGTGPSEIFGSAAAYHRSLRRALDSGVVLDHAMLYLDARLSHKHPTVEIRVADVCLQASDTVLIAGLSRALVETAAREWRSGSPPAPVPASVLRLSAWQASRWGIAGNLLHPVSGVPCPAGIVISLLFEHTRQALADAGDETSIRLLCQQVLTRGTGSRLQREAFERGGLVALADAAAYFTHLTRQEPALADDDLVSEVPGHS